MGGKRFIPFLVLGLALFVLACSIAGQTAAPGTSVQATQIAQTVIAQVVGTSIAGTVAAVQPTATSPVLFTPTFLPTSTWVAPSPLPPTPLPPTQVPPTPVPPTATAVPPPCLLARFVANLSVPDGSLLGPGTPFTKTWRLKNDGSCSWNRNYDLVFSDGDRLDSDKVIPFSEVVSPGETVDLSVEMVAPEKADAYRGEWLLRSSDGDLFGTGERGRAPLVADIRVVKDRFDYAYDLALNLCSARWSSDNGRLPCPGFSSSPEGSAVMLDQPELETGRAEDELTLWIHPEAVHKGWVAGQYPAVKVLPGDHFVADIGCLENNPNCDLTFELEYRLDGGNVQKLGSWHEVYDERLTRIDIDLTPFGDHSLELILSVINNGNSNAAIAQANGFWLAPSIRRPPPGVPNVTPGGQSNQPPGGNNNRPPGGGTPPPPPPAPQ